MASSSTSNKQLAQEKFRRTTQEYFTLLEEISIELRREVRLLNDSSGEKVMPINNVVPKTSEVGKIKEREIWLQVIEILKQRGVNVFENSNNNNNNDNNNDSVITDNNNNNEDKDNNKGKKSEGGDNNQNKSKEKDSTTSNNNNSSSSRNNEDKMDLDQ